MPSEFSPDSTNNSGGDLTPEQTDWLVNQFRTNPKFKLAFQKYGIQVQETIKANRPYYKLVYAKELKAFLDVMLETKAKTGELRDTHFTVSAMNISLNTLWARINQAFNYLCEQLPEQESLVYITMYEQVELVKNQQQECVTIHWTSNIKEKLQGTLAAAPTEVLDWKAEFQTFLEEYKEGTVFERTGLNLSPDDIESLQMQVDGLEEVMSIFKFDRVKVVILPPSPTKV